jgi:DNA-binding transcriptional LysR family regulator
MDINSLITFANVIKLKSISRTSKKEFITQPGVSLRLKKLEQEIGLPLFTYHDKQIYPTEAGKRLFSFADLIDREHQHLLYDLDNLKEELTGDLKICTSLICGEYILPSIVSGFSKKYPSVGIRMVIAETPKVFDDLKQGIYEIGFSVAVS